MRRQTALMDDNMLRASLFLVLLFLVGCATPQPTPTALPRVNVLPLALDDVFSFRKTILFHNSNTRPQTRNEFINARTKKINYGAVDNIDYLARRGNYFTFYWRANRPSELTVRLEYRTQKLGDYVQAREISYTNASGTIKTEFAVIGDDYLSDGPINSWRAVLIEDGKIVALTQSYLWN